MIRWQYYPKSDQIPDHLSKLVGAFNRCDHLIKSPEHKLPSNDVLGILTSELGSLGFRVETGKKASEKIKVPVLFGENGRMDKSFEADAVNDQTRTVVEIEAGRGYTNNQFLKDLFQACMMHNIQYLTIAVRNMYNNNPDFDKVVDFFDALYASARLKLPLAGLLIVGY